MIGSEAHPVEGTGLGRLLAAAVAADRRSRVRELLLTLVFQWLVLLAGLFVLDLLLSLPAWIRWIGLLGQVGLIGWRIWLLAAGWRLRRSLEWAARQMEDQHPELDSALINALQFQEEAAPGGSARADRMQQEIARGEQLSRSLSPAGPDRVGEQLAFRRAAGMAAAWLLVIVLFPAGCRTIFPRLFAPWREDTTPPFSLTRFVVTPPGCTIRYGESLKITIRVYGPLPDSVDLVTRTPGSDWRHIALAGEEPDRYSIALDSLRESTWFYVEGGGARSARYLIHVARAPALKTLRVVYAYPAYTGLPASVETVDENGLHGLPGTRATLDVQADIPLGRGVLQMRTRAVESLPLQVDPKDRTHGSASLVLLQPGSFRIDLAGEDGLETPNAARGPIRIEVDQPPSVWIAEPGSDLLVTPEMKVPVVVESQDDYGIARVQLHRIVNDLGDSPLDLPLPARGRDRRKTHSELFFDLPDLGVRPGDVIRYYATAYDTHPDPPNVTDSEAFTLKVITPEEYRQVLAQQQQDLPDKSRDIAGALSDLARRQKAVAEAMEQIRTALARSPSDRSLQARLESARQEQRSIQRTARELAQQMREEANIPPGSAIERAIRAKLAAIAAQIQHASDAMQAAQSGNPAEAARAAREASRRLQAADAEMQRQLVQTLQYLEEILPLFEDIERFKELVDEQGQLVLRAREYQDRAAAGAAARARLEQIGARQAGIEQELQELVADFVRDADACQQHFPRAAASGRRIAEEIGQRHIPELTQEAYEQFDRGDGPGGFQQAQEALRQMEAMLQDAQSGQSQGKQELDIALTRSLGQSGLGSSLAQLAASLGASLTGPGSNGAGSGGRAIRVARAYRPGSPAQGGGGSQKHRSANTIPGRGAPLAPENVEFMRNPAAAPPRARAPDTGRYPPEYRKLIQEYFKSVAENQQQRTEP